jgi:hypothetical protein
MDKGYSPSLDSVIDRDEGYSPSPDSVIDRDEGYSPSLDSVIDRDEGYSPYPDSAILDRDEGYSPSLDSFIDRDEGYSPSPNSVSLSCDHNSLSFKVLPRTHEIMISSLESSQMFLFPQHLPFFPSSTILRVAQIPSWWSGLEALQMGTLPYPLIDS